MGSTPNRRPTSLGGLSGHLSLHELNNRLEKYIQQIRLEPERNPAIITYERHTEGGSFDITSLPQYKEWERLQQEYLDQEKELAEIEAEIEVFKHTNDDLKKRNSTIEAQIREIEAKINEKRIKIQELEARLKQIEMERQRLEQTRMSREKELAELQSKVISAPEGWIERKSVVSYNNAINTVNKDKKDFIDRLSKLEWVETRTTQSINTQEIHDKIKKDYDDRLREELEKMRLLYGNQLSEVKLSIEKIYSSKIKELMGQRNEWNSKAKAEVDEILARLQNSKAEVSYEAMLAAKRKEIDFLEQESSSSSSSSSDG